MRKLSHFTHPKLQYILLLYSVGFIFLISFCLAAGNIALQKGDFVAADNPKIQYTGRIDFTDPKKPKFWSPGVYIKARFQGTYCNALINDQVLWGHSHNYIEIIVDDKTPVRIQTTGPTNTIQVAEGLPDGAHTLTICKDSEAGIGSLEFVGLQCKGLLSLPPKPARKIEFIGDSITVGSGSDLSTVGCDKGQWYDQQNTYLSYGPTTARQLNAQWHVTAVSGIGLMHSCCDMKLTMPDVFDKVSLSENAIPWDFKRYQPDVVTVCLGQNDGIQEPTAFCNRYLAFIEQIRGHYPKAQIICLTSPMADASLTAALKENLTQIVVSAHKSGDKNVQAFFFSRSWNSGCGGHPDLAEHQLIANELTSYLKNTLSW